MQGFALKSSLLKPICFKRERCPNNALVVGREPAGATQGGGIAEGIHGG